MIKAYYQQIVCIKAVIKSCWFLAVLIHSCGVHGSLLARDARCRKSQSFSTIDMNHSKKKDSTTLKELDHLLKIEIGLQNGRQKIAIYHRVIMPGLLLLPCWPGPLHSPGCTSVNSKVQWPPVPFSTLRSEQLHATTFCQSIVSQKCRPMSFHL